MNNLIGISGKIGSGKDTVGKILQALAYKGGENFKLTPEEQIKGTLYLNHNYQIKKYADKLKDMVCLLIGCTREQLEDREFKEKELGEEWWYISKPEIGMFIPYTEDNWAAHGDFEENLVMLTPRKLFQLLGTDCGRDIIHPNIWVNALFADYKQNNLVDGLAEEKDGNLYVPDGHGEHTGKKLAFRRFEYYAKPNWIITDCRFPNECEAIKQRGGIVIRVNRNSWKPKSGDTIKIKVFSNWSVVTYTHTNDEGNHYGVGADGYKYKSSLIREYKEEHPSETALDDYEFDHVIDNNGTLKELIEKIKYLKLV